MHARARTDEKDVGEQLRVAATTHARARTDEKDVGELSRVAATTHEEGQRSCSVCRMASGRG